jgi:hypothetical protein
VVKEDEACGIFLPLSEPLSLNKISGTLAPWLKLELLKKFELQIERSTPRKHGVQIVSPPRALRRINCSRHQLLILNRSVPTQNDILVPETLLKKRKSQEKAREERALATKEKRGTAPWCTTTDSSRQL